ncbi:MAG: hypothetical protein RLW61_14060 [Gammaproteobacteria bacterium]
MNVRLVPPLALLTLLVVTFFTRAVPAQEGRYQAIAIDSGLEYGTEKALLLDTFAGHLWIWVESPAVNGEPGGRYLIYQGQLEPGKTMGQVIDRQEWETGPGK